MAAVKYWKNAKHTLDYTVSYEKILYIRYKGFVYLTDCSEQATGRGCLTCLRPPASLQYVPVTPCLKDMDLTSYQLLRGGPMSLIDGGVGMECRMALVFLPVDQISIT